MRYQRALREHERDGHVSDPELAARIRAGWHPGVEMAVMTIQPDVSDAIKAVCLKTLLENVEAPKAAQLRLDASGNPDVNITVLVAPWAGITGSDGAQKVIEVRPAIDVTANDPGLEAHRRSSAPTPVATEAAGREYVELDEHRAPRILRVKTPLINHHTGERWKGTPPETITPVDLGGDPFK
jgi:hypothetical protein